MPYIDYKKYQLSENNKQQFIIDYFNQLRNEICLRVQLHSNYILQKIVICGVFLGFLFNQKVHVNLQVLGFFFVPIIAMIFDVMIARNIRNIHRTGQYLQNIEKLAKVKNYSYWETFNWSHGRNEEKNYGNIEIYYLTLFNIGLSIIPIYIGFFANSLEKSGDMGKLYPDVRIICLYLSRILIILQYFTHSLMRILILGDEVDEINCKNLIWPYKKRRI